MRLAWLFLLVLGVAGCGVAGPPVPPGSDIDPRNVTDPAEIDPDNFFG